MRDGWNASADFLTIDGGPHGFLNGGHAHADSLSIEVAVGGRPLFVDGGTFSYSVDLLSRNHFRSTAAHNTLVIDGASSSELGTGAFQWDRVARTHTTRWESTPTFDLFEGWHDGFMRLSVPARHERTLLFVKGRYWVVRDRVVSDGAHDVSICFHCASSVQATRDTDGSIRLGERSTQELIARLSTFASRGGVFELVDDSVSPRYGQRVAATTCVFKLRTFGSENIVSFIVPARMGAARVASAGSPGTFIVAGDGFEDTVSVGTSSLIVNDVDLMQIGQRIDHTDADVVVASSTQRVGE